MIGTTTMTTTPDFKIYQEPTTMIDSGLAASDIVMGVLSLSFGLWAWVVRKFGEQHIESVKQLATELREMRRDLNGLAERVKVVEVVQQHYHPKDV